MTDYILPILMAFVITMGLGPVIIPYLRKLKFGQFVRDDGPSSHLKKSGTPTMGGIIFLIGFTLTTIFFAKDNGSVMAILLVTLLFGAVGFIDDYIKVILKRSLGLKPYQKLILQLGITIGYCMYLLNYTDTGTKIILPFSGGIYIDLGVLFIPFVIIVFLGTVNGVNLTDGLDGLATSVTILVATFFFVISIGLGTMYYPVSGALVGSLLAFLAFNSHPARVFMGDTGSLALGGFVAATAIALKMPLLILIVGLVYLVECISVIIQVGYFKLTQKRVFKMAPIHHHYELKGWQETKIVAIFGIITTILCLIGLYSLNGFY